jgi:hypothetical protein
MSSRGFGEGLAKVGGSPVWAARPWDTLYNTVKKFLYKTQDEICAVNIIDSNS